MKLDDELEFGLQFLRDDGHEIGEPEVRGSTILFPVDEVLWPEEKVRQIGRQAAETQIEINRGEDLARLLAEHVAGMGASGATQAIEIHGQKWIVSVAMEGTEGPPAPERAPESGWIPYRKDKRA